MSSAAEACGKPYSLNMGGTANVGQLNMKEPYPVPKFIQLGQIGQYQCLYDDSPEPGPDPPWGTLGPSLAWESSSAAYVPNVVNLSRYITTAGTMSDILGSQGAELDDTLIAGEVNYNANHPGDSWSDFLIRAQSKVSWLWGSLRDGGCGIVRVSNTQVKFIGTYGVYNNETGTDERIAATQTNSPFNIADIESTCLCVYYDKEIGTFDGAISVLYPIGSEVVYVSDPTTFITSPGNIIYGLNYGSLSDVLDNSVVEFGDGHVPNTCIQVGSVACPYGGGPYQIFWPSTVIDIPGYSQTWGSADTGLGSEYERGGDPDGNGAGDFNNESDPVPLTTEDQFTVDAQSCGFVTVFEPTKETLQDFAEWLYGTLPTSYSSFLDNIGKLQKNPMDAIISLNLAHYEAPTTGAEPLNFFGQPSGLSAPVATKLTHVVKCGSVHISEYSGNFLDYTHSKIQINLPYCGKYTLPISEVMGSTLTLQYIIDILTGACVAEVKVTRQRGTVGGDPNLDATIYRFNGNIFQQVPISAVDYTGILQGQLGLASGAASVMSGNILGGVSNMINSMATMKPNVEHVGNAGASYGYMSIQVPFVIQEYAWYNWPQLDKYYNYYGMPTGDYRLLDSMDGYTEIDPGTLWTDKFDWITQEEEDRLKSILNSGGVFIDHTAAYYDYDPDS